MRLETNHACFTSRADSVRAIAIIRVGFANHLVFGYHAKIFWSLFPSDLQRGEL